jgi:hypothetical protein
MLIKIILILIFPLASFAYPTQPDPKITPGKTIEISKVKLCKDGYTHDVRFVSLKTKHQVFERYKIPWSEHAKYEVDHFISLELGGMNDIENLWPQIYCKVGNKPLVSGCFGAREKDRVETNLHKRICDGKITIAKAQDIIKTDWVAEFIVITNRDKK